MEQTCVDGIAVTHSDIYNMSCPVRLSAHLLSPQTAILFSWYKDMIPNFVRPELKPYLFISGNGKLYFSSVTEDDEGYYHCMVSPPGQYASRAEGKVSMPIELEVIQTSEYSCCGKASSIVAECNLTGTCVNLFL